MNDVWTWDFVFDRTESGTTLKWLSIIDEYTRECVALVVDRTITSETVINTLSMRRFTRLTNAFSKKLENHAAAIALHFMHYNFGRIHQTLRCTPAMRAGITDHIWSIEEIVGLLEFAEKNSN